MRMFFITLLVLAFPASGEPSREGYLAVIPVFWANLYPAGGTDLYCGTEFGPHDRRTNIEHVFPMGWVTRSLGCGTRKQCRRSSARFNTIESDLHNLYPALRDMNEARGAMRFDEIPGERWINARCDFEIDTRKRRVEPRPAVRGDIARAMLYMEDRYGLEIYRKQRELLLRWHRADPPDAHERWRNDVIARLQGNRNRFIDGAASRQH